MSASGDKCCVFCGTIIPEKSELQYGLVLDNICSELFADVFKKAISFLNKYKIDPVDYFPVVIQQMKAYPEVFTSIVEADNAHSKKLRFSYSFGVSFAKCLTTNKRFLEYIEEDPEKLNFVVLINEMVEIAKVMTSDYQ